MDVIKSDIPTSMINIPNKENLLQGSQKEDNVTFEDDHHEDLTDNVITKDNLEKSVEELNNAVQSTQKSLKFELHDESDRTMVKVVDLEQDKVIKEIPPKEVLDMIGRIKEMVGIILDEKI